MTNNSTRALIIGGGIAGSVAAMALAKAGCAAEVFEAYDRAADGVGSFLTLAVNGIEALRALDIDAASLGGFETPRMVLRLGDGKLLTEFPFGPDRPVGGRARTIARSELYTYLRDEAARRGVTFTYGKRLIDAARGPDGRVVARFADGTEARGEFLVGADGLRSRVREIIDPGAPKARYLGLMNTGGYAHGVKVDAPVGTMEMVFGKKCFFGYVPRSEREVWWFANPARAREPTADELRAISPEAWRAELLELFAKDASPACDLIRATETIVRGWNTYDFPRVPRWHREAMVLIGDAAHAASPSSGQGASMAIEDAIVLARCVRDAPSPELAFAAYEAARRPRVERIVAEGKKSGDGKTPGTFGRVMRDFFLKQFFRGTKREADARTRWLYEHDLGWDRDARASVAHGA